MCWERGETESRIRDQQLDLFADRVSSSDFDANHFRLLFSSQVHRLIEGLHRMVLLGDRSVQNAAEHDPPYVALGWLWLLPTPVPRAYC